PKELQTNGDQTRRLPLLQNRQQTLGLKCRENCGTYRSGLFLWPVASQGIAHRAKPSRAALARSSQDIRDIPAKPPLKFQRLHDLDACSFFPLSNGLHGSGRSVVLRIDGWNISLQRTSWNVFLFVSRERNTSISLCLEHIKGAHCH